MNFLEEAEKAFQNLTDFTPKSTTRDYHTYMQSPEWAERKRRYYQDYGRQCVICDTHHHIELHHLSYADLGNEMDEDLVALCRHHHAEFHRRYGVVGDMHRQWDRFFNEKSRSRLQACRHERLSQQGTGGSYAVTSERYH